MARAMPTRAFWPPESWCGKRSRNSVGQADLPRQLLAARAHGLAAPDVAEPQDRIGDRAHRREARVEAVGGVLEHHLDALAQRQLGELLGRNGADVLAVEHDAPVRLVDQAHDHGRGRRLAAAGLADQADALAAVHGEADAVDGTEGRGLLGRGRGAVAAEELGEAAAQVLARILLDQLLDHQQRRAVVAARVRRAVELGRRRRGQRPAGRPSSRPRAAGRARMTPGRGVARISFLV